MRLFVAADLPPAARAACAAWRDRAGHPALRPVPDASLHVTLSFLGEVGDPTALPGLLEPCPAPARGLSLGPGRWLPERRPRVLALDVEDAAGELRALWACVAAALADAEARPFRPHVTVARVRGRVDRAGLPAAPGTRFDAVAVTLYRSHLGQGPARYEALWSAPLGPG